MKKYAAPCYSIETVESEDIILTSVTVNGATIKEVDASTANVSVSIKDVLGLR